jgi:predicted RNA-binding Zn ribbon-like protein
VNFNSHTDAVVGVAVDLVNIATPGETQGKPYVVPEGDGLRKVVGAALSGGRRWMGTLDLAGARAVAAIAGQLREVFVAIEEHDLDAAAAQLNQLLQHSGARPHLLQHDGGPWHLHYHGSAGDPAQDWAAGCATALAVVVGSEHADRLGVCSAPHCDRVYVDTSRNGTRRFCSTNCQNRVKAAAFRARRD